MDNQLPQSEPERRGGARPGAGRKPQAVKFASELARLDKRIAKHLATYVDNMDVLANGGYARVEEQWAPAGSLYVGSGEFMRRMYPEKPVDELVLIKRTVSIADKDRQANEYLINRIAGKPTERKEHVFPDKPLHEMTEEELRAIAES